MQLATRGLPRSWKHQFERCVLTYKPQARHTLRMIRTIAVCISALHKRGVRYYGAIIIRACRDILCTRCRKRTFELFHFYGTIHTNENNFAHLTQFCHFFKFQLHYCKPRTKVLQVPAIHLPTTFEK